MHTSILAWWDRILTSYWFIPAVMAAGSMITVAGVTFPITIAAVSYPAGQFRPRILTKLMRDRCNQVTLGTLIATFLSRCSATRPRRAPAAGRESP